MAQLYSRYFYCRNMLDHRRFCHSMEIFWKSWLINLITSLSKLHLPTQKHVIKPLNPSQMVLKKKHLLSPYLFQGVARNSLEVAEKSFCFMHLLHKDSICSILARDGGTILRLLWCFTCVFYCCFDVDWKEMLEMDPTVDGQNPAPPRMMTIPLVIRF